jgi:signal transduction histidine kinase
VGITYAPSFSADGQLLSVVANLRDISRFREADELKATFISVISHELRTPVALIKGYVGTLRREDADWDRGVIQNSLAVIEEEADHLAKLIDDLLEASRLQSGSLALSVSDVDLARLASEQAERFKTQSEQHRFLVSFPPDFPIIPGDEQRLTQVISNLISNAVKYAREGGDIEISGRVRGDEVLVCVSDQGPGIAPEDRARIFERFYRSAEAAKSSPGAGLGLFLAKSVVEAHGGRIWVDQAVERGARICFSLPRLGA